MAEKHKFIDKDTGKEVSVKMVCEIVKMLMLDFIKAKPENIDKDEYYLRICYIVANMFKDTTGIQVSNAIKELEMRGTKEYNAMRVGKGMGEPKIVESRKLRFPIREDSLKGHGGLSDEHASVMPNPSSIPRADGYYNYYRMSVHAAGFPNKSEIGATTAFGNNPFTSAYTDEDQKMIDYAAKICGFDSKKLGSKKSEEPESVHKISPVNSTKYF